MTLVYENENINLIDEFITNIYYIIEGIELSNDKKTYYTNSKNMIPKLIKNKNSIKLYTYKNFFEILASATYYIISDNYPDDYFLIKAIDNQK